MKEDQDQPGESDAERQEESSPPHHQRCNSLVPTRRHEDIPVPKGLALDRRKSTVIETPRPSAARLVYGRHVETDSPDVLLRTMLEANGARRPSSTTSSDKGTT